MSYIKAEKILPEELIRQIQEYADGVYIYIPRKPGTRHKWGQETSYKAELETRNDRIRKDYAAGVRVAELSCRYHLSEKASAGFCKIHKQRAGRNPGSFT